MLAYEIRELSETFYCDVVSGLDLILLRDASEAFDDCPDKCLVYVALGFINVLIVFCGCVALR